MNFISFRERNRFDLSGSVLNIDKKLLNSITITVTSVSSTTEMGSFKLGPVDMFLFPNLPKDKYTIKITSNLDRQEYVYKNTQLEVDLVGHKYIEVEFPVSLYMVDTDVGSSSIYGLFFGIGILIIGYNYEYIQQLWKRRNRKPTKRTNKDSWTTPLVVR